MIERVLVSARGEVAARIARTCKRLAVTTIAVFAEGEADALHVQACDEAVPLPAGDLSASYLSAAAIVDAAKRAGAHGVIAGYGLLADDAELARAVMEAEMRWVGPSPAALGVAQDRLALRRAAVEAEVRTPDGSDAVATLREAHDAADRLGYPLVVKPVRARDADVFGEADDDDELEAALVRARERDGGPVVLERRIERPRHVEVEVLADLHGDVVVLGEREASLRHERLRLVCESPAPAVVGHANEDYVREALAEAAQRLVKAARVVGPASAQFVMDPEGRHHLVGLRVGLSPEHALHEACTGVDIVEMQLRLAIGEAMPLEAQHATATGHAASARLLLEGRAEGVVAELRFPPAPAGRVRIETGLAVGVALVAGHDEVIAYVTAYAPTRHQAVLALDRAIAETVIAPQATRIPLLRRALAHEAFRAGQYDVTSVERMLSQRL